MGATVTVVRERELENSRKVVEVLVRKVPESHNFIDVRLSVLGSWGSGKSTLVGVLTDGQLDNADGRARLNLFRHVHEIESGRTSSVSQEIFGFDDKGNVLNYAEKSNVEDILNSSSKIITLIDQPGHDKYLKTTMCALTSQQPDYAILVVSCTTGITNTTKEHLGLALALKLQTFIVLTKSDAVCKQQLDKLINCLEKLLKYPGIKKVPFRVFNEDDAFMAASSINGNVCPYFVVSSVTGRGLNLLTKFLYAVPSVFGKNKTIDGSVEHQVDSVYDLAHCGTVVAGTLAKGVIKEKEELYIGPDSSGNFFPVKVQSIHRSRVPTLIAMAGQAVALALGNVPLTVRKGMVLSKNPFPICCIEFDADIKVLFHHGKGLTKNFQCVVHINNVCQTAIIEDCSKDCVPTNSRATVRFRFLKRPEFISVGSRLLFREGRTKGTGDVLKIYPYQNVPDPLR